MESFPRAFEIRRRTRSFPVQMSSEGQYSSPACLLVRLFNYIYISHIALLVIVGFMRRCRL